MSSTSDRFAEVSQNLTRPHDFVTHIAVYAILFLAAILRFSNLEERTLWFDEGYTASIVSEFTFGEMFERLSQDVHPPLYYFTLKTWRAAFGGSVFALRSMSVFFGIGAVWLTYKVGREFDNCSVWIGIVGAFLLAVSGSQIELSQEMRMYSMMTFLSLLSALLLFRATGKESTGLWLAVGLSQATLSMTHNFGLFITAGQWILVFATHRSKKDLASMMTGFFLIYGLWLPILYSQVTRVRDGYWIPEPNLEAIGYCVGFQFVPRCFFARNFEVSSLVWVVEIILFTLIAFVCFRQPGTKPKLVAGMMFLPFVIAVEVSFLVTPLMIPRYFAGMTPFSLLCVTSVVLGIKAKYFRAAAGFAAVTLSVVMVGQHFVSDKVEESQGTRGAVHFALANSQPGDAFVSTVPFTFWDVRYYLRDTKHPVCLVIDRQLLHNEGLPILKEGDLSTWTEVAKHKRIWVIDNHQRDDKSLPWWMKRPAVKSKVFNPKVFELPPVRIELFEL